MVEYTPQQRAKNQRTIILVSAVLCGVVIVSGRMQSWPLGSYVVGLAAIALMAWIVWALFAGHKAKPLDADRKQARWPYLSKKKMDEIIKNNAKR